MNTAAASNCIFTQSLTRLASAQAKIQHRTLQQAFTIQTVQLNAQTNTHTHKYEETNSAQKRRILQPERRLTRRKSITQHYFAQRSAL